MLTHALVGLDARRVEVEAHVELGQPGFTIVGLADRACQEAKHRVRSGIASAEPRSRRSARKGRDLERKSQLQIIDFGGMRNPTWIRAKSSFLSNRLIR